MNCITARTEASRPNSMVECVRKEVHYTMTDRNKLEQALLVRVGGGKKMNPTRTEVATQSIWKSPPSFTPQRCLSTRPMWVVQAYTPNSSKHPSIGNHMSLRH
jgi:hypothetical protein